MSPDPTSPDTRTLDRIDAAGIVAVFAAWVAVVLDHHYGVAWLDEHVLAYHTLFVAGLAAITLTRSVRRWGSARVGQVTLRCVFSVVMLAVGLTAAEFALRFIFRDALEKHPRISINRLGFRERQVGPKDPNRYRIVVIGDSFTFGDGIEEQERFSNLMQGFLGDRYEVLNFGTRAHNMPQHLKKLERVLSLSPDFVLLQLYENDFETAGMTRPEVHLWLPSDVDRRMVRSFVTYRLSKDAWVKVQEAVGLAESYSDHMVRHLSDPNSPDAIEAFGMLRQFIDRSLAAGVPTGTVLFPALWALQGGGRDYPFAFLHDRVQTICTEKQIPCLDLFSAMKETRDPRTLWVSAFDAHPNAQANRRAAFEILNAFGPAWSH